MKNVVLSSEKIDKIVEEAKGIAAGDYNSHVDTAKNHAALQARIIEINGELIKTIRSLDEKNGKIQKYLVWLAIVAGAASLIALFK